MNGSGEPVIQVFGRNDSKETRRAQRFFKERRMPISFVDLKKRPPAPGELRRFAPVSYTHLTLPTTDVVCRSRWSPYH